MWDWHYKSKHGGWGDGGGDKGTFSYLIRQFFQGANILRPLGPGCPPQSISTAGNAHVATNTRPIVPTVDNEVVAFRLAGDRVVDRCLQTMIALTRS